MSEIVLAVALFTGLVMTLVLAILLARAWIVGTGTVTVTINGSRTVSAPRGDTLLGALVEGGLLLPSACGGKGTCGQCRVTVLEGGGDARPTEAAVLSSAELSAGARLACQVTLRDDLQLRVPDELFGVRRRTCRVRSSRCVATLIKEIVLELPPEPPFEFRAGSFVQVRCPPYRRPFRDFHIDAGVADEWDRLDLWRHVAGTSSPVERAYSLANAPDERGVLVLDVRIAIPPPDAPEGTPPGVVSSYLFGLQPGDPVEIAGPYGNFFAIESEREMVFVGGGAGMAPLRSLIRDQLGRLGSTRTMTYWYGARSRRELFHVEEFERLAAEHPNFRFSTALSEPRPEDDWTGPVGFIHDVLHDRYLAEHPSPEACEYYLCGPPMMIAATRRMLDVLGVSPGQVLFDDFGG